MSKKPIALIILDGWGKSNSTEGNCMAQAKIPNFNNLISSYPNCILHTCGTVVGLPEGVMGNSEVGHENIGGGRTVTQKFTLISETIKDGSFFTNEKLLHAIEHTKKNKSKLHIIGLISEGDVHSHLGHLYALFELAKRNTVEDVILHAISDGRDDPPKAAIPLLKVIEEKIKICRGKIATVSGRFYAMDRDNRWNRVELYYKLLTEGLGQKASSAIEAVENAYRRGEDKTNAIYSGDCPAEDSDEFVLPTLITNDLISDNDAVIFFNFRPDRAREISIALTQESFKEFERKIKLKNLAYVCLTEYDKQLHDTSTANPVLPVAFTKKELKEINKENGLGELFSKLGKKQIRIAETEKFRHVTSFFNMGRQEEYPGEDRVLIPSPKVKTYDLKPEMSAYEVGGKTIEAIKSGEYDLIVVNFANADMVGHTGIISATVKALEVLDKLIGEIYTAITEANGTLLITADHGNADQMFNSDGSVRTAHSLNPVPFIVVGKNFKNHEIKSEGSLADIAPTILDIAQIEKPKEMTGCSLLSKASNTNPSQ